MATDQELLRDVAARGEAARRAMAVLFERHFRTLCRRFGYRFPNVSEAEVVDAVSTCLLKAFEQAGRYRGEASFHTWVGSMIQNALTDHLRKSGRTVPLDADDRDDDPPAHQYAALIDERTPLTETDLAQLRNCVALHFSRFRKQNPEAALAIHEHFVEQVDLKELSAILGRSYGATRQFVSKEVGKLRRFLEPCLAHLRA